MGCDGGTIPRRDELVQLKKKPEKKDKVSERLYRWRHCAVSQIPLKTPIVACELGRMYNKDEVIKRLLDRSSEQGMSHIRGLKDIKELNLSKNPCYHGEDANLGDELVDRQMAQYICPITSQEMNGKFRFFFYWTCGCVLSERALKEVKSSVCIKCGNDVIEEDVIILNSTEGEQDALKAAMISRRVKAKAHKKAKRTISELVDERVVGALGTIEGASGTVDGTSGTVEGASGTVDGSSGSSRIMEAAAGTSGNIKPKKRAKMQQALSNSGSLTVKGVASTVLRDKDFENVRSSSFSVAADPKASEVYKSLFDTHKTATRKQSAFWVTCNPQYF